MALLRRSHKDDVDVESMLANLHRIAHVATIPFKKVIDLRRGEEEGTEEPGRGRTRPGLTSGRGAAASSGRTQPG